MAWKQDKPVIAIYDDDLCMCAEPHKNLTIKEINDIYQNKIINDTAYGYPIHFIPFNNIELTLYIEKQNHTRNNCTFRWVDENNISYSMFGNEFNRIFKEYPRINIPIHGIWSAEKHGKAYGITLVKPINTQKEN